MPSSAPAHPYSLLPPPPSSYYSNPPYLYAVDPHTPSHPLSLPHYQLPPSPPSHAYRPPPFVAGFVPVARLGAGHESRDFHPVYELAYDPPVDSGMEAACYPLPDYSGYYTRRVPPIYQPHAFVPSRRARGQFMDVPVPVEPLYEGDYRADEQPDLRNSVYWIPLQMQGEHPRSQQDPLDTVPQKSTLESVPRTKAMTTNLPTFRIIPTLTLRSSQPADSTCLQQKARSNPAVMEFHGKGSPRKDTESVDKTWASNRIPLLLVPSPANRYKLGDNAVRGDGVAEEKFTNTRPIPVIASEDAGKIITVNAAKEGAVVHHNRGAEKPDAVPQPRTQTELSEFQDEQMEALRSEATEKQRTAAPAVRRHFDEESAAVYIQSLFRGYSVRKSDPLKHLRLIAGTLAKAKDLHSQLADPAVTTTLRIDKLETTKFAESLMALILQLDTIQGAHPLVRERRKAATRELIGLQEVLDSLNRGGSVPVIGFSKSADEQSQEASPYFTSLPFSPDDVGNHGADVKLGAEVRAPDCSVPEIDGQANEQSEDKSSCLSPSSSSDNDARNHDADDQNLEVEAVVSSCSTGHGLESSDVTTGSDSSPDETVLDVSSFNADCQNFLKKMESTQEPAGRPENHGVLEKITKREQEDGAEETRKIDAMKAASTNTEVNGEHSIGIHSQIVQEKMELECDPEALEIAVSSKGDSATITYPGKKVPDESEGNVVGVDAAKSSAGGEGNHLQEDESAKFGNDKEGQERKGSLWAISGEFEEENGREDQAVEHLTGSKISERGKSLSLEDDKQQIDGRREMVEPEGEIWERLLKENRELKWMVEKLAKYSNAQVATITKIEEKMGKLERAIRQQNSHSSSSSRKASKLKTSGSRKRRW